MEKKKIIAKNDYEKYINDILKISPITRFIYGKKDKETLSHIENYMSEEYLNKIKEINYKYKYTKDIQLKEELEYDNYYIDNNFYLLIFSSYVNFIVNFQYENNNVYPKNIIYKKSREKDFLLIINSAIERAKIGLNYNITYPKIIIKKFMNQIKNFKLTHYKLLYNFIKNEYYPKCRTDIGLCYIKNGKEAYKVLIRDYLGNINITPEEIHETGKSLIKKPIKLGNTYKSRKELFDDCIKYANYVYNVIINKYFDYKPKQKFIIKPVPKILEKSSPLGYYNDIENKVFVNLSYYFEVDKNELYSFIMHECMHFYHYQYMKYLKVPKYKMYNYSNIALVEGFAHYMETYSEDYDDDNNSFSLLRKIRLVVDTGINYFGWTYKQSFDYMNKYMQKKKTDNINEIDRYICMPGQALCYLIGKLHIIKLRDDYLSKKKGTIKDFHRELLIEGLASFTIINKKFGFNS